MLQNNQINLTLLSFLQPMMGAGGGGGLDTCFSPVTVGSSKFTHHPVQIWLLLPGRETWLFNNRRMISDPYPLIGTSILYTMVIRTHASNVQ